MSALVNQVRLLRSEVSSRGGTLAHRKQVRYLERRSFQGSFRNFTLVFARELGILGLITSLSRLHPKQK
ncbi:hypothetical protein DEV91_11538 [Phyllobacterium brassicacearum]|nr:hypothetical protein DEV91_11538 [Phyllobacterium brassicacearum]